MPGLGDEFMKHEVTITCPGCGHKNQATFGDVQRRARITCRGCQKPIALQEDGHGLEDVRRAMQDFERAMKKLR
jgi:ribosomal protein S27E